MSQVLENAIVKAFLANAQIVNLVGKDSENNPAIWPYHQRDADENVPYPHVTFARFGDITERGTFQDDDVWSVYMDCPRIAVCVWADDNLDTAYDIYNKLDSAIRGPGANLATEYVAIYKARRTHLRDDLFDEEAKAYHIHSEYSIWCQYSMAPGGTFT